MSVDPLVREVIMKQSRMSCRYEAAVPGNFIQIRPKPLCIIILVRLTSLHVNGCVNHCVFGV